MKKVKQKKRQKKNKKQKKTRQKKKEVQVGHPYSKSEWYQSVFKKKKK
jgi:hypothetical protein